ncbi:hypothetical protein CK203_099072, partial [Vitis vinifera]
LFSLVTFFTPTTSTALHDLTTSPHLNLVSPLLNLHCYYYSSLASRLLLGTTMRVDFEVMFSG